ncbi:MAG: hypothetical protein ACFFBJ_07960 [Promethearchaeota archaeon]
MINKTKKDNVSPVFSENSLALKQKIRANDTLKKINLAWMNFRQQWESREELLREGPSKSEYFFLLLIYPYLYLFSGVVHEFGHIMGALVSGAPIVMLSFAPTVFSVTVNGFGRSLTFAKLMGGVFQGTIFLALTQRFRVLWSVTIACFVYAVAEVAGIPWLMFVCAFFSEIIVTLTIIYLAY